MTLPSWSSILALLQILLVGYGTCLLCRFKPSSLGLRGLAVVWTGGTLVVGLVLLWAGLMESLQLAVWMVGGLSVLSLAGAVTLSWLRRAHPSPPSPLGSPVLVGTLMIVAAWLVVGWAQFNEVPLRGDEKDIWAARAELAREAGGFGEEYREALHPRRALVYHPDYPALNPLLLLWMSVSGGEDVGTQVRWPIQLFDLCALLYLAGVLRRTLRPGPTALLTAGAFLTTWYLLPTCGADRMVALGALMATDGAVCVLTGRERGRAPLCSGLLLMAASKHEGTALAIVLVLAMVIAQLVARPRPRPSPGSAGAITVAFLLTAAVVAGTWQWNQASGIENDLVQSTRQSTGPSPVSMAAGRAGLLLRRFAGGFLLSAESSALLLLLAVTATAVAIREWRRTDVLLPALVALGGTAAFLLVFAMTPRRMEWHWDTAGSRVLSQLNLVAAAWAGAALARAGLARSD